MYPCTNCGLSLQGPVCPRCGQAHSAPGHPLLSNSDAGPPGAPNSWEAPRPQAYPTPGAAAHGTSLPSEPDPAPRSGGSGRIVTAVAIGIAILSLGAMAWLFLGERSDTATQVATPTPEVTVAPPTAEPVSTEPNAPGTMTPSTTTSAPAPTTAAENPASEVDGGQDRDIQQVARTRLEQLREESVSSLNLDGRWVAVLSTKKSGTKDESQTARNGSHVFYEDDILAMHENLVEMYSEDADVFLGSTSDFGKQPKSGDVFWRTFVDRGFQDEEQAANWCDDHFSGTVEEIKNACLPKQLVPPTQP